MYETVAAVERQKDERDAASVRNAVKSLMAGHDGYCGIFNGNDDAGYSFIIGSRNLDCNDIAAYFRKKLSAKCGGKSGMIQGHIDAPKAAIRAVIS